MTVFTAAAAFLPSSKVLVAKNKILTGTAPTSSCIPGALQVSPHQTSFFNIAASSLSPVITPTTSWLETSTTLTGAQQPQQFDAVLPDPLILIGMSLVVIISIVAAIVWNTQVVPVSRTKLAVSKAKGAVKEYLDELRVAAAVASSTTTTTTATSDYQDDETGVINSDPPSTNNNNKNNRSFERWLFSDWLRPRSTKKAPAIPESLLFGVSLKDAKWNSGDNPVLVTTAMMMVGIVVASIAEQFRGL